MPVRLVPLGGLGEIGLNCLAVESGPDALVVDCGLMFPGGPGLGVEYVVPDLGYLRGRSSGIRGILVTHAHEDHIGALPLLLRDAPVPVFGSRFTLGRLRQKLDEAGVQADLRELAGRARVQLGPFEVEAIRVTHSVPEALGFAIGTPEGRVIHTGDFKVDNRPGGPWTMDLARLGELGDEGVAALLSDSTNAEREGWSLSEAEVGGAMRRLFTEAPGRVVVALFGSNVQRVQLIAQAAGAAGRSVTLAGRSLIENCALAQSMGLLRPPPEGFLPPERAPDVRPRSLVVVTTGAQGEPRAGLARMVMGEHKELAIEPGDTVVFSSRAIPGNDLAVAALSDALARMGARVLSAQEQPGLHATGHACAEEQRLVLSLVRPQVFVPIHGQYRMLARHAELARAAGVPAVLVAEDGQVVELAARTGRLAGEVPTGRVHLDAGTRAGLGEAALSDRRRLGQDGILVALAVLDRRSGSVLFGPELWPRGVPEGEQLLAAARQAAGAEILALDPVSRGNVPAVEDALTRAVRRAYRKESARRPLVLPVVVQV